MIASIPQLLLELADTLEPVVGFEVVVDKFMDVPEGIKVFYEDMQGNKFTGILKEDGSFA
ncbi:hypothetical protein NIES4101_53480 [Calothrix sp. NIES-4101]|nr:hypothetical protein NIES4101_53480 [Calothrix sp. NIES-4101]